MKKETTAVRGIRLKETVWNDLQKFADETEMGNLNHLVNKIFHSYILSVGKKKKKNPVGWPCYGAVACEMQSLRVKIEF